ncbi:glycosyltransferase [Collinsella ihumii]|uniref:glycosyltransferase n=1 Tax=Collinsella ihumii TaxID=1720204 RepID=UPI0025AA3C32|nr:glycosyltransferase [Collinsella ihumii]MDN0056497.1 glycosyltransferase [Collinsella ihumii]
MLIKVLHVVGIMNKGGIETFVLNVVRHMDRRRFTSEILCTTPGIGAYEPELDELGVPVHKIGEEFSSYKGKLRYIGQYRTYKKWFDAHEYDVVHVHGSHAFDTAIAVKAGMDSRNRSAIIAHSHTTFGEHAVLNSVFAKYLAKTNITRLACSEPAAEWMFGKRSSHVLVKNGIDTEEFRFDIDSRYKLREELGISTNETVVTQVGRLVPVKNHEFMFDVIARAQSEGVQCKLLLVGDGPDRSNLERRTEELGIARSVLFLGLRSDVSAILSASDVFVMPSHYEGLGIAAVEAQASGLPTLVSDRVPCEVCVTELIKRLPISIRPEAWVNEIASTGFNLDARGQAFDRVRGSGYDIKQTVEDLAKLYCVAIRGDAYPK